MENLISTIENTADVQIIIKEIRKDYSGQWDARSPVDIVAERVGQARLNNELVSAAEEPQGYAAYFDWWK